MGLTRNSGESSGTAARAVNEQPLNRRRALRLLGSLAVAAGAVALNATRPESVQADGTEGPTNFTGDVSVAGNLSVGSVSTLELSVAMPGSGTAVSASVGGSVGGVGVVASSNPMHGGGIGVRGTAIGAFGSGTGVYGSGNSFGVYGTGSTGVYGTTGSSSGSGVEGTNSSGGTGVLGTTSSSARAAVEGDNSGGGTAVYGNSTGGGTGVYGVTSADVNGPPGVAGKSLGGGPGVVGYASGSGSIGTGGVTDVGYGFYGGATGSGTGVLGFSASGTAIWGAANGSGYSGQFTGGAGVIIYGALTIAGGPKSAAVKGADGKLRRLYSLECPESWFEDFGSGQLTSGSATVQLEPGFAGVVKTDAYHLFLTPRGDSKGLYVSSQTPSGFTIHEQQGGVSNIAFDYRVVAKRKDIEGARLEHIEEPALPALPKLPEPPPTPPAPAGSRPGH
jgi:hypothetical protein